MTIKVGSIMHFYGIVLFAAVSCMQKGTDEAMEFSKAFKKNEVDNA